MSKPYDDPKKGRFLLAEPFLQDPNFVRTVVLLTEHNQEGSIGFVLNRPIEYKLNEILPDFPEFDVPVYLGGPVQQDSLHFIHRVPGLGEAESEISEGVFWGGNFEVLKALVSQGEVDPDDIRFFVGYSGWAPQQLEGELEANSWIVSPAKAKFAFSEDHETLWKEVMSSLGKKYKIMSNYPTDPSLN